MKIALITIHWANNYGAALQVYACAKTLSQFGQTSVIDYRCEYTSKGMQLFRFGWGARDILRIAKDALRVIPRYRVIKKFAKFNSKYLPMTPTVRTESEFHRVALDHDKFVSGSDQIWNPRIVSESGTIDSNFFLEFAKDKPRISYASSMGTYQYSPDELESVRGYLEGYHYISVRESDTANYLKSVLGKPVEHVLDPTLLMDRNQWIADFSEEVEFEESYILVYALKKDKLLKDAVEGFANLLGMKVYAIDQDPLINYSCDKHLMDVGPEEFIGLFANASFVITNSFHGTAFAVNFNIPFVVTTPPTGLNRIESLLNAVGLEQRIIHQYRSQEAEEYVGPVDFIEANEKLSTLREHSFEFLKRALHEV